MTSTSVSASHPAAAHSIEPAMHRTLLDSMVSSPYGVDAIWLIVMVSIWSAVPEPRALVLAVAYGVMAAIRYAFHFLYVRRKPADDRLKAWLRVYVVISVGIGLGWTAQTLVLLGTKPDFVWVLPLVALGVMTVNAAYARALYAPVAMGFFIPALLPQAIGLLLQSDPIARGLGIGNIAYLVALTLWTRGLNRRLRERFTIEAELRETLAKNSRLQEEIEHGRHMLHSVLDNLDDGVELYDARGQRVFGNAAVRRLHDIPLDVYDRTTTARDMVAWRVDRGEFGPVVDRESEIERRTAIMHDRSSGVIERPTATGDTVELRFKPLPDGGVLAMHRNITRLKQREAELATAKEEAEVSRLAAETAQNVMRKVLDAIDDGVILIDRTGHWRYTNRAIRDVYQIDEATLAGLPTLRDIFRYQAQRGDYGPLKDPEASMARLEELFWRGEAARMGRTVTGRWLDYQYHPLPDGSIVMTHRDITDLKRHEDELATAKEEAERARAEAAQALERLQVVIDNMSDGVMLFDRDLRWAIDNQKVRDLLALPEEVAHLGAASADIQRFQIRRGDFGPIDDVEADIQEWLDRRRSAPGLSYTRWTAAGRCIEYTSRPLPNGEIVASYRDITEFKRHEEELARAKEEAEGARATMRTVLENLTDGVVMYDRNRHFVYRNAAMGRLYGIDEDVLETHRGAEDIWRFMAERGDFGPIEDVDAWVAQRMDRLRQSDGPAGQLVSATGRTIEINYRSLPDDGLLAVHRDITEIKHTQAEAEQARNRLEDAIRSLPSGFSLHDAEARLVVYNDSYDRYFGNTPGLLKRGEKYEDLLREMQRRGKVRPEHRERGEAWIAEMAAHHRSSFGDREMATADERWIRISKHPTRDGGVVTLVTDLTESKARERDLARAQASAEEGLTTARKIIENMPIGAALVGADNAIRLANQPFTELLGLPAEFGAEGRPYVDALAYISRRGDYSGDIPFEVRVRDFFTRIRGERDVRYERAMPDGRHVEFRFTALSDGGFLGTYVDITESRRQQEALARARADAESAFSTAHTIIDMTPVGVALIGGDRRIRMANQRFTEFLDLPREHGDEGRAYLETMRYIWSRGDFGEGDFDRSAADFFARLHEQGGMRYEREMPSGRQVDFSLTPLPDGGFLGTYVDVTQSRRQQAALASARAEAEEALATAHTLIETMPIGASLVGPDLRVRRANRRLAALFELPGDFASPGRPFIDAMREIWARGDFGTDGFEQRAADFFAEMRKQGELRYERQLPNGRHVDFHFTMLPDGGFLGAYLDVTEVKNQQAALAQARAAAEEALSTARTIIETMPVGSALVGPDLRIRLSNDRFTEMLDLPPELGGEGCSYTDVMRALWERGDFPDTDFDERVRTFFRNMREKKGMHYQRQMPNGRYIDFSSTLLPDGGFLGTYVDTTEAMKREAELATARDAAEAAGRDAANARTRLVDAIESLPNGFVLFDADGRLVLANQRFLEYYAPIADITVPGARIEEMLRQAAIRGAVSTGGLSVEDWVEKRMAMRRNPGTPRETRQPNGRWVVIGERRTREGGFASIYTDISELKRREAELEQARDEAEAANQAKSTFLATMSHEIRTPMNGVLGMMEILERQGIDGEQQATVETMRESAQALLRIIDDVLDFSKIEAGRLELESTAFSLSGVIEGAMAAMRPQAADKNLPLSADIDPGSSDALEGDPVRFRQILLNLLSNAVKFTERGSVRIATSTAPLGDGRIRVSLSVADSGIGMDDAQLSRLFEPFAQADSSTTRRYGGTGLGLSIVRRLAQLMEGDVSVESKPGTGTTFRVTMVLRAAPADSPLRAIAPIATRARRRQQPAESAARVLVVDDHPVNLKVLVKQLQMLGIAADTAVDGVEALAMWRAGRYAVVLADIHMPRMDGYELAGAIRREEAAASGDQRRTPLVAVTANAMRGEEERCLAAGMDAYLAKPVTFDRLRAALSRWLPLDAEDGEPSATSDNPAIDHATLQAWLGDDPAMVAELLQDFLRDARQAERDVGASLGAGKLPELAATAHRLKGSALAVGARRLAEVAARLELAGRTGDRSACQDGLGALARELRRVAGEIGG